MSHPRDSQLSILCPGPVGLFKYLLSTYYVPGTALSTRVMVVASFSQTQWLPVSLAITPPPTILPLDLG